MEFDAHAWHQAAWYTYELQSDRHISGHMLGNTIQLAYRLST